MKTLIEDLFENCKKLMNLTNRQRAEGIVKKEKLSFEEMLTFYELD